MSVNSLGLDLYEFKAIQDSDGRFLKIKNSMNEYHNHIRRSLNA